MPRDRLISAASFAQKVGRTRSAIVRHCTLGHLAGAAQHGPGREWWIPERHVVTFATTIGRIGRRPASERGISQ